jgi:hypothetical protein
VQEVDINYRSEKSPCQPPSQSLTVTQSVTTSVTKATVSSLTVQHPPHLPPVYSPLSFYPFSSHKVLLRSFSQVTRALESGFGGLEVAWWPLVPKLAGSNPAEAEKILSTPSFGGEVKPSAPCRALRHVKEPKSDVEVAPFDKISRPFLAHSSTFRCWVR